MKIPADVKAIRARVIAAFGVPSGEPGDAYEERLRQWSIKFAEQVAFELPGQGYGVKRGDPNRPIGKDTLARQVDGRLIIWDLFTGSGTGRPSLNDDPDSEDITGQFFETRPEYFLPTNHLGVAPPAPAPPPTPAPVPPAPVPPTPVGLSPVLARLDALGEGQQAIERELAAQRVGLEELLTRPTPPVSLPVALVGTLFGYRVRLTWEK